MAVIGELTTVVKVPFGVTINDARLAQQHEVGKMTATATVTFRAMKVTEDHIELQAVINLNNAVIEIEIEGGGVRNPVVVKPRLREPFSEKPSDG